MSRILYLDCFSGASGDMVLGALIDAGLPIDALRDALGSLGLDAYEIDASRVSRAGIAATQFRLAEKAGGAGRDQPQSRGHDHDEASHPHHHRSLADITARIRASRLSPAGQRRATQLFERLAEAEAEIHQMPVDRVHLHEVGALDSIVDIVGAVFGFEWFGADVVAASALNVGSGMVECAHGTFPVPAPATTKLLAGVPIYSSGAPAELVTPTGALLVTGHAIQYGPVPPMTIERVGYGAGSRDLPGTPNVLRILVGRATHAAATERVVSMQFEVDDMNPQIFGPLMDRLYAAGALEVLYSAVQMKKNRPGTLVTIVASPERRGELADVVFHETTTIGVRYQEMERECLARETVRVQTPAGPVRVKVASRGGLVVNAAPEFEDCAALAAEAGLSIKEVQAQAMRAYLDQRPIPLSTTQRTEPAVNEPRDPGTDVPSTNVPSTDVPTTAAGAVPAPAPSATPTPTTAAAPASTPATPPAVEAPDARIAIDEFMNVDLRVAKVTAAERVPNSRKLIKLEVDLGSEARTLVAGIAGAYEAEALVGRTVVVVANLKPARLMGIESNGMVLAASLEGGLPSLVGFEQDVPPGTRVR